MEKFRKNINAMTGYVPGFQPDDADVVKLNTNENPYPPSPKVMEAIASISTDSLRRYPPVYWDTFRQAAGNVLKIDPNSIVCGNGGDEILTILVRCCCDNQRPLAYPVSTYSLYPILANIQDCQTIEIPFTSDGQIPDKLFDIDAGLTILCNPNAPSTTLVAKEDVARLTESLSGVLLIDEAYVDFADGHCLDLVERFDNVAILRSMSKGYSLAGLRFGYCVASKPIVEAMCKVKDSYNLNAITQAAATAAIMDQDWLNTNVQKVKEQRTRLTIELRKLGLVIPDSQTNFLLAKVVQTEAKKIYQKLLERKIFIRYFEQADLADKIRITIGTEEQNTLLINALSEILS